MTHPCKRAQVIGQRCTRQCDMPYFNWKTDKHADKGNQPEKKTEADVAHNTTKLMRNRVRNLVCAQVAEGFLHPAALRYGGRQSVQHDPIRSPTCGQTRNP